MLASALKYFRPLANNRLSADEIISGGQSNVWDPVLSAQRAAETIEYEKIFFKIHDEGNETAFVPRIFFHGDCSQGDDFAIFFASTQRGAVGDINDPGDRFYTAGTLASDVNAGDQSFTIQLKDAAQAAGFQDADEIIISTKSTPGSVTGNEQYLNLNSAPVVSGDQVTVTFTETLDDNYLAGALVASIYKPADIETSLDSTGYTGGANGNFSAITLDNIGTTDEDYTCEILAGATQYSVVGDTLGVVGTGNVSSDYSPLNPDWDRPRFTIPASFFDGLTLSEGDTFSFSTHPAAVAVVEKKVNPENAQTTSANSLLLYARVEGA